MALSLTIETEREDDGRWIAEIIELPGVLAYGETQAAAMAKVKALALTILADELRNGEREFDGLTFSSVAA